MVRLALTLVLWFRGAEEWKELKFEYVLALINNCGKCVEYASAVDSLVWLAGSSWLVG